MTHAFLRVSFPSAFLTLKCLLNLGLPYLVWSTFRFSQPLSGLLPLSAYRSYFIPNPLLGFDLSEFFPSKDSERLSTSNYRLNLYLNTKHPRRFGKSNNTRLLDGGFHGFTPFRNPYVFKSG
jgi:hypothetical protein